MQMQRMFYLSSLCILDIPFLIYKVWLMLSNTTKSRIYSTPNQNQVIRTPASPKNSISSSRHSVSTHTRNLNIKKVQKYQFNNLDLAYKVRQQMYKILIAFDKNSNLQFQQNQIKEALVQILQETPYQLSYVTKNVYRYDSDQDGIITYEQFTNFCLQQHFGEMAIQRLHRLGTYKRGKQRIMSCQQFYNTLSYCLKYIDINPDQSTVSQLFEQLDNQNSGFISYSQYFTFLKQYFGSKSQSAIYVKIDDMKQKMKNRENQEQILNFFRKKKNDSEQIDKNKQKLEQQRQIADALRKQKEKKDREEWDRKQKQKIQQQKRKIDQQNRKKREAFHQQQRLRKLKQQQKKRQQEQKRRRHQEDEDRKRKQLASKLNLNINSNGNTNTATTHSNHKQKSQINILCQRISRLVYHQLKITLLDHDIKYLLSSDKDLASEILQQDIKIPQQLSKKIIGQHFKSNRITIPYEQLLQACVSSYMTEYYPETISNRFPLNKQNFIQQVIKGLHFIRAKPIGHILQSIFEIYTQNEIITDKQFHQIMRKIFNQYRWPRKTGQERINTRKSINNSYFPHKTDR